MYGNGAVIGMAIIAMARRQILRDHLRALTACYVVAIGTTTRWAAECRIATPITQTSGPSLRGCALPYRLRGIHLISYAQASKNQSYAMRSDTTMRIQIFTIPIHNGDVELEALNKFLVSHRVIDLHKAFIVTG